MPWRNGKGNTIELLKEDLPNRDGFAWRLSMADVTSDGEFSNFSDYCLQSTRKHKNQRRCRGNISLCC